MVVEGQKPFEIYAKTEQLKRTCERCTYTWVELCAASEGVTNG